MESPDAYNLARIDWQFFGTLTFASARIPEKTRLSMWFALARKQAKNFRLHFPALLWCLRQEEGESTGRRHFHYLLGGLPEKAVSMATCFAQMADWEKLGGGMARVRLFDPALSGVGYVTKCLGMSGADAYESSKFDARSSGLMLSKSGGAMLARKIRDDRQSIESVAQSTGETNGAVQASPKSTGSNHAFGSTATGPRATDVLREMKKAPMRINVDHVACVGFSPTLKVLTAPRERV